ncbi:MAG: hypothetical protein AMXMBFR48_13830 [Ignavibacteriales bacterium]
MKKLLHAIAEFWARNRFSVMIVPRGRGGFIKSHSFNAFTLFLAMVVYTSLILVITYFLIVKTPVKDYVFVDPLGFTKDEIKEINTLNSRVKLLVKEVDDLKRINQNLRNAILLADSNALRSVNYDELKKKTGGSLFYIVKSLLSSFDIYNNEDPVFRRPSDGITTDDFKPETGHFGMDFSVKEGTPVFASANGYVVFAGYTVDDGYQIVLAHRNNFITVYKHCSVIMKKPRDKVYQGEVIALSGNSGKLSYGPHLHFELWKDGTALDPRQYLLTN